MSVLSSMRYCLSDPQDLTNLWFAFFFMPFGLFFDFFDGKVARWRKKSSLMGQELDSLADLVRMSIHEGHTLVLTTKGLVRCSACCCWLRRRLSNYGRHFFPLILRSLYVPPMLIEGITDHLRWVNSPCTLQCDGCHAAQR